MILYIGISLVAQIIAINDINGKRAVFTIDKKKVFSGNIMFTALLMYTFLFVLSAYRAETIGKDTIAYIRIFNNVINSESYSAISTRIEIGFRFLCSIIGRFTNNPLALIIVSSTICYAFTGAFIFSSTDKQGIMVAIFSAMMFRNYCSGIRQAIAFSICLIAYMVIKKEKYYIGSILILLAATFHVTALISLFYYVIPVVMKSKRFKYVVFGLIIFGFLIVRNLDVISLIDKYSSYYEGYYNEMGREKIGYLSCALTMFVAIYIFVSYIYIKKITNNSVVEWNDDEAIWFGYAILIIGIINFFSNNASRLMWYFEFPFLVKLINRTSEMQTAQRQRIIVPIVLLYQFVFILNLALRPYYFALIPYKFWGM